MILSYNGTLVTGEHKFGINFIVLGLIFDPNNFAFSSVRIFPIMSRKIEQFVTSMINKRVIRNRTESSKAWKVQCVAF